MSGTLTIENKTPLWKKKKEGKEMIEKEEKAQVSDSPGVLVICLIFIGHIPQKSVHTIQIPLNIFLLLYHF